jgi:hypothetical protein
MPYYIELFCRIADEPKFRFLGPSGIHESLTMAELARQTNEPDLMAKFRPISVPPHSFRSGDEDAEPAIVISDGRDSRAMPSMSGDQRPYADLDSNGLPSKPDILRAQKHLRLSATVSEALGE